MNRLLTLYGILKFCCLKVQGKKEQRMDLTVGQKAYREMTVTEEMVRAYAEITG